MATKATSPRTPASSERPEAASPSNMTREQEKEELQHLNDRLTVYTDKVRSLKEQNRELTVKITSIRTQTQEEVASVRSKFESELADARRLADDIAKEKAREQIENRKNAGLADEYKKKLDKEVAAHKKTEDALKAAQRKLCDKEGQLVIVNQKARNLESVVQELRKECQELKDALESAKYALEEETLTRVDLENKLQSKDEELNFQREMYDKEIRELRSQLQGLENQLVIRIKSTVSQYEGILQEKIQELRELYDSEAEQYKDKYDKLQGMYSKGVEELSSIKEEKRTLSMTVENLKSELSQLQSKNASLVLRIEDLEKLRAGDQTRADDAIASRDVEIIELRERNDHLMRVKTALDLEISTYRKILEVEEKRLNITPPASPVFGSSPQSSRRSVKRVRTEEETVPLLNITPPASPVFGSSPQSSRRSVKRVRTEEETVGTKYSNQGYIQIKEANADGKYIKLFNSGSKDCALGGWSMERSVDGEPAVVYKFTPKYVLKSGTYVTIWAAQGGGQHKPPTDLLFKKIANWGVGKETRTVLIDPDGQEVASALTEEVSVIRSDETDSRPERQGRRDGEVAKGCVIQ